MKKTLTIFVIASLLLSTFMFVNAAEASKAKAKFGAASIDGVISDGEYGNKYEFNSDNATPFPGNESELLPYDYYFNWTEDALYVAIAANLAASDWGKFIPQFNFNPWNIIPSGEKLQGLFLSFEYVNNETITFKLHNHDTAAKAGAEAAGNKTAILDDIEHKLTVDGEKTVLEFKLPVDVFRIKSSVSKIDASDKKFEANQKFGFSAFLIYQSKGWGQTSSDISNFEVEFIGLGEITLQAEATPTPEPTATPDKTTAPSGEKDDGLGTGAIVGIVIGVVVVAAVVVYLVTKKK